MKLKSIVMYVIVMLSFIFIGCEDVNEQFKDNKINITINIFGNGYILHNDVTVSGILKIDEGQTITIIASPDDKNRFIGWYINNELVNQESSYTFIVEEDIILTAKFDKIEKVLPSSIIIEEANNEIDLKVGEQKSLSASIIPSNTNESYSWSIEDSNIASISKDGLLKALSAGSTYAVVTIDSTNINSKIKVVVSKTANIVYIIDAILGNNNDSVIIEEAKVIGISNSSILIEDITGKMIVQINDDFEANIGDILTIEGTLKESNYIMRLISKKITKLNYKNVVYTNPIEMNIEYFTEYINKEKEEALTYWVGEYVYAKGKLYKMVLNNQTTYSISIDEDNGYYLNLEDPLDKYTEDLLVGETIEVKGFLAGTNDMKKSINIIITEAKNEDVIPKDPDKITIYSINDLHGTIFQSNTTAGISKIGQYLMSNKDDNTLIISGGDMFQGTAVSSMTRGNAMVDIMNTIGFDAMAYGNHEFDWGVDVVTKYTDGNPDNGEANFSMLACNIESKSTGELASWAKPYAIYEKGGYKVGVIGVIGQDQTTDILASYIKDYEFTSEINAIKKYTQILRNNEQCDIVILSCHFDSTGINNQLSSLTGEFKVDAIINGHTHQNYYGELTYGRTVPLPYVQSGSYGYYISKMELLINPKTRSVVDASADCLRTTAYCTQESPEINAVLSKYQLYIDKSNEQLGISGENINQSGGGNWAANVLKNSTNSDIGICNSGGIRGLGFPINKDSVVTYGDIFEIMPFENAIVTVYITGEKILRMVDSTGLFISTNVNRSGSDSTINGVKIEEDKLYKVATIDFLFEKTYYPFISGSDIVHTNILFREAMVEDVKRCVEVYGKFYVSK